MATKISDKKLVSVINYFLEHGERETLESFPKINAESLGRYKREYRTRFGDFKRRAIIQKITSQYSDKELQAISAGGIGTLGSRKHIISRAGEKVKFGYMTDTHIGSIYFRPEYFYEALKTMEGEGCEFIIHTGDITDGLSNRPDHIYQLTHFGYERQKEYAVELMSIWEKPWYTISGNHDRWYMKSAGANVAKDVTSLLPNGIFLGDDEGDLILNGIDIKLWHGEDGNSYALSYRVQKIIESFTGGEKPHILLCGHTHKKVDLFERNIHAVSGGALSCQSKWMRSKKIANHTGYHIIEYTGNEEGVSRFKTEWFPFY